MNLSLDFKPTFMSGLNMKDLSYLKKSIDILLERYSNFGMDANIGGDIISCYQATNIVLDNYVKIIYESFNHKYSDKDDNKNKNVDLDSQTIFLLKEIFKLNIFMIKIFFKLIIYRVRFLFNFFRRFFI